jgi:hypothetical protein
VSVKKRKAKCLSQCIIIYSHKHFFSTADTIILDLNRIHPVFLRKNFTL